MTLFGIDVSNYQAGIDMRAVAAQGCAFVLAKVTQGCGYTSPAWPTHRDGARAAGLLLAGYHFVTTEDPAGQAAHCKAALGDPAIPLALDWEDGGGDGPHFLAVLAAFRAAGLHVALAYAPHWYWAQQGCPDLSAAGIPLWASNYVAGGGAPGALYAAVTDAHWSGYAGLQVELLQFTDAAVVAGTSVDASAYPGTRDQLAALLAAAPAPASPPPSGEDNPVIPIAINPDQHGDYRSLVMAECGSASTVVANAWITFGVGWMPAPAPADPLSKTAPPAPAAKVIVTALGAAQNVLVQQSFTLADNARGYLPLPDGTAMATVEGNTGGGIVAAGLVEQHK